MITEQLVMIGGLVRNEQDTALETQPLDPVRLQVLLNLPHRKPSKARAVLLGAALTAAAAGAILFGFGQNALEARVGDKALGAGAWIAPSAQGVPLEFSDGSRLVFAPGTRARLGDLTHNGAHVVVEAGRVDAAVIHRTRTNYRLSFGPFAVDVTGTKFDVNWDPSEELLTLRLREGSVVVSGCLLGSGRPLMAGETLRAWCKDRRFEVSESTPADKPSEPPKAAPSSEPASAPPVQAPSSSGAVGANESSSSSHGPTSEGWQALARGGQYQEAMSAIGPDSFSAECDRATLPELGLLADVARFSNKPRSAIQAYTALRRRFPGGQRSGQAAFAIARLHFDQLAQYDDAAQWFRTYLGEQPRGPFSREALGRLMESEQRSGQLAQAKETARKYLERYAKGPHARLAERLLAN